MTKWQHKDETGRDCTDCGEYKTWDNFNKGDVKGHRSNCRDCQKKRERNYDRTRNQTKGGSTHVRIDKEGSTGKQAA